MLGPREPDLLQACRRLLAQDDLDDVARSAFEDFEIRLTRKLELSRKQKEWLLGEYNRRELDSDDAENLYSSGKVPEGRFVPTPAVLQRLPKSPPRRRA